MNVKSLAVLNTLVSVQRNLSSPATVRAVADVNADDQFAELIADVSATLAATVTSLQPANIAATVAALPANPPV